jgi:hypothetical protein
MLRLCFSSILMNDLIQISVALSLLMAAAQVRAGDFSYTVNDGTVSITGYTGAGGVVAIPASIQALPVTRIGGQAFASLTNLASVSIPDTVTNIEDGLAPAEGAFSGSSLTNVVIGNNVNYIGTLAFAHCDQLSGVVLPDSVSGIGQFAFGWCGSLSQVTFGNAMTNLGPEAFYGCSNLVNVTMPGSLGGMGDYALAFCSSLTGVFFQGNAPVVSDNVFSGDPDVTVYYLPGTTGWGPTLGGSPTRLWNPQVPTAEASFGVHQNGFGFNIAGTPGIPLVVQASSSIAGGSWTSLQTCTLTNGLISFVDPQWTNSQNRFYRLRSP